MKSRRRVNSTVMWISLRLKIAAAITAFVMCASTGTAVLALKYRAHHHNVQQSPKQTEEYRDGKRDAERDLANGYLRYRIYGMPEEWDGPNLFAEHLLNDYGVELVRVADCIVSRQLENRTSGYNDVMLPVIEARYGKGVIERVHKQAADEWERTHKHN